MGAIWYRPFRTRFLRIDAVKGSAKARYCGWTESSGNPLEYTEANGLKRLASDDRCRQPIIGSKSRSRWRSIFARRNEIADLHICGCG